MDAHQTSAFHREVPNAERDRSPARLDGRTAHTARGSHWRDKPPRDTGSPHKGPPRRQERSDPPNPPPAPHTRFNQPRSALPRPRRGRAADGRGADSVRHPPGGSPGAASPGAQQGPAPTGPGPAPSAPPGLPEAAPGGAALPQGSR